MNTQITFMLKKNRKYITILPPDLALCLKLISSHYPCLEHLFMVPKVFEPLKLYCSMLLLVIQGSLTKTWDMHVCQEETNSDTTEAIFYTAFSLKYAPSCILTASLKQSVQETLVNLFIST